MQLDAHVNLFYLRGHGNLLQ